MEWAIIFQPLVKSKKYQQVKYDVSHTFHITVKEIVILCMIQDSRVRRVIN
jgi:hypothetical protein